MRKLTVEPRINDYTIRTTSELLGVKLDAQFISFIKENAGLSHFERYFTDKNNTTWEVIMYVNSVEFFKLTEEFKHGYKRKLIPFAFDPGGWHFCLCLDEGEDYDSIIVNRWTDHLPEYQFLRIADSFEEFIEGLKREDEV